MSEATLQIRPARNEDIPVLQEMGVAKIFTPGAPTTEITDWVAAHFDEADSAPA